MDKLFIKEITILAVSLERLISETERLYEGLGTNFSSLLGEITASQAEAAKSHSSQYHQQRLGVLENGTRRSVKAAKEQISDSETTFNQLQLVDQSLIETLKNSIDEVQSLELVASTIKALSEKVELIALNAMTVALKAGKDGGAFSFITDELQRLSTKNIVFSDELSLQSSAIQEAFAEFRNKVLTLSETEEGILNRYREELPEKYDRYQGHLLSFIHFLRQLSYEGEKLKDPVLGAMNVVQNQDIIRQSIDHVILGINELKEAQWDTEEELLDVIVFMEKLQTLSVRILDGIRSQIENDIRLFNSNLDDAKKLAEKFVSRRNAYFDGRSNKVSDSLGVLNEYSTGLLGEISKTFHKKDQIVTQSRLVLKEIQVLQKNFRVFSDIVGRFHNINVASQIEVTKQDSLKSMLETVKEMRELTKVIETQIDGAMRTISSLIKKLTKSLSRYRSIYQKNEFFVDDLREGFSAVYSDLSLILSNYNATFHDEELFDIRLKKNFEESKHMVATLQSLVSLVENIQEEIQDVLKVLAMRKDRELKKQGFSEWSLHSDRLKELVERFTIFEHKQSAGELGGFSVESGNEEGEVTFF